MKTEWSSSAFGGYMNSLLKRYFAEENVISPEAVELRAAWRTSRFVYCVFSVKSTRGIAYLGMELPPDTEYWRCLFGGRYRCKRLGR